MSELLVRFDTALRALDGLLETAVDPPVSALAERGEALVAARARLARARESLAEPLTIVLLGGTGVGKSALINALAGSPIAKSSPIRPTTDRITVYVHEGATLSRLEGLDPDVVSRVEHGREALRDKVLIDAPDFDSVLTSNRALLERILDEAEFVLVVVDREKYLNRSLHEILRPRREGRAFAFAFNKVDHPFHRDETVEDLRGVLEKEGFGDAPVFPLAATKANEDPKRWGLAPLTRFLEDELDAKRIERFKLRALGGILESLLAMLREGLPASLEQGLAQWRAEVRRGVDQLEEECLSIFRDLLAENGPLGVVVSTYLRGILKGPAGIGVRLVEKVSGWAGSEASAGDVDALKMELRVAAEHVDPTVLSTRLEHLHRSILRGGGAAGLSESWLDRHLAQQRPDALGRELMRSVAGDLLEVFEQSVAECRESASTRWLWLLNLPVFVALGYSLFELIRNLFVLVTGIGYLFTVVTILLISLVPTVYIGLLWVRMKRDRALQRAKARIRQASRRALEPGVLRPVEAIAVRVGDLLARAREIEGGLKALSEQPRRRGRG